MTEGEVYWTADADASTAEFVKVNNDLFKIITRTYHDEANIRLNREELRKLHKAIGQALFDQR